MRARVLRRYGPMRRSAKGGTPPVLFDRRDLSDDPSLGGGSPSHAEPAARTPPLMHLADPSALGSRYVAGEEIGTGAIAKVVRVHDRHTGRRLAAKVLHERHARDAAARERFAREAELTANLRHENLVGIEGITTLEGRPALLMELVEGPTLAAYLATKGRLEEPELRTIIRRLATGLAFAHAQGIVHRDLKPANVLLARVSEPGQPVRLVPKIADFGMARAASFATADKRAMTVLGTPPYMAPECLDPLAVDPRTDLYALGCIIHELATGAPPFGGPTPFAVLEAHRQAAIPRLPEPYSKALADLVVRLLAKVPGERPQSAFAVVDALDRQLETSEAPASALVLTSSSPVAPRVAASGRCAGCGASILAEVRICFSCGLTQLVLEPGPLSVFVVGPGSTADKLDTELRDRLLDWLGANAALGLDPSPLRERIPRVPFVLLVGISETAAQTLLASLERLGLEAQSRRGGRFSHGGLMRNIARLAVRKLAVVAAVSGAPALFHPGIALFTLLPAVIVFAPIMLAVSLGLHARPAAHLVPEARADLPAMLRDRLSELFRTVEGITHRRHREALGAVVRRTLQLSRAFSAEARDDAQRESGRAIALASVATRRMDELDRLMGRPDFDPSDPAHRSLMHERDTWSARLLDLTATLDVLAARMVAAQTQASERSSLSQLEATVEALEEVHQL